jgi:hypothetical protein
MPPERSTSRSPLEPTVAVEQVSEMGRVHFGNPVGGEVTRVFSCRQSHARSGFGLGDEARRLGGHRAHVGSLEDSAGQAVRHDFRHAPEWERDDRAPGHLSLDRDAWDALDVRCEEQNVDTAEHLGDISPVAQERDVVIDAARARIGLEGPSSRSITDDDEVHALSGVAHALEHVQCTFGALLVNERTDEAEERDVGPYSNLVSELRAGFVSVDLEERLGSP